MKLKSFSRSKNPNKTNRPVRNFNEMAAELGMSLHQLSGHWSCSPIEKPKVAFVTYSNKPKGGGNREVKYYYQDEFLTWWKKHLEAVDNGNIEEES